MFKALILFFLCGQVQAKEIFVSDYLDTLVEFNLERNYTIQENYPEYALFDFLKQQKDFIIIGDYAKNVSLIADAKQASFNGWYSLFFYLNELFDNKIIVSSYYKEKTLESVLKQCLECSYKLYANSHRSSYRVFRKVIKLFPQVDIKLYVRDIKGLSLDSSFKIYHNEIWYIYDEQLGLKYSNDNSIKINLMKKMQYRKDRNKDYTTEVEAMLKEYRRLNGLD